jgi:hypothetical protein
MTRPSAARHTSAPGGPIVTTPNRTDLRGIAITPVTPHPEPWGRRTAADLLGVLAFLGISLWADLPFWELVLRSDIAPVAWLSSALLFACAALAWTARAQGRLPRGLRALLSAALVLMALVGIIGVGALVLLYRAVVSSVVRGHLVAAVLVGVVLALGTHFGHLSGVLWPRCSR